MAYIISSGITSDGIILEKKFMTILNGGIQVAPDPAAKPHQIIYLNFDGELTRYRNADLDLKIDDVLVEDSMLTQERIAGIVASLNAEFSDRNVLFTSERPGNGIAYSTIYVGRTSAFDRYGCFAGLAETVDSGNRVKDDNAFVLLDATSADSDIISTISHEAKHLIGTIDHGGDGLTRYASIVYSHYQSNCTFTGDVLSSIEIIHYDDGELPVFYHHTDDGDDSVYYVCIGSKYDKAVKITVKNGSELDVGRGGMVSGAVVSSDGSIYVDQGGSVTDAVINVGGIFGVIGGTASAIRENGGMVWFVDDSPVTFAPNSFSGLVLSQNQSATIHSGTTANYTSVNFLGQMNIFSGGIANDTTLNSRGHLYVSSGGTANDTTINSGYLCIESGGTANSTTLNSGGIMVLDSVGDVVYNTWVNVIIVKSGGIAYDTMLNCSSYMDCTGSANRVTFNSGGTLFISSGGTVSDLKLDSSCLIISSGGTAQIYRPSTLQREIPYPIVNFNYGTIEFLVDSAAIGGEALLNDYEGINDFGEFVITVDSNQASGEYRLVGNAWSLIKDITIRTKDTGSTGTFTYNFNRFEYDSVTLGDRKYMLSLDDQGTLSLVIKDPVEIDYQFTEIGQIFYYDGDAPEGSTLEGVLMAIPYTADITVTIDKDLSEGQYEFTTSVAEVPGSVNQFQIQISEGLPGSEGESAPKYVTYNTSDMCLFGTLVSETNSTVTYKFTDVEDYLLIDSIPDDTLTLAFDPADNEPGGSENGQGGYGTYRRRMIGMGALAYSFPDANKRIDKDDFNIVDENHCWVATACNMMAKCGYLHIGGSVQPVTQNFFVAMSESYYNYDKESIGGNATRVFKDFLIKKLKEYYTNKKKTFDENKQSFWKDYSNISEGLDNLKKGNGNIVAAIGFEGYVKDKNGNSVHVNHVITCYYDKSTESGRFVFVDSDDKGTGEAYYKLSQDGTTISYYASSEKDGKKELIGTFNVTSIMTLISKSKIKDLTGFNGIAVTDITRNKIIITTPRSETIVYAGLCTDFNITEDSLEVSGLIRDSAIMEYAVLRIRSGAEAEKMVVHTGGSAEFQSGAIVKGNIRTTGGTFTVESGVDVSEAEFEFAVSRMDGENDSPLLNDLHNVSDSKLTITIVNGQSAGRYVLAGGASDFEGTLSVVGDYDYLLDAGDGFRNGLIGELGLENTLNIEHKIYSLAVEDDTLVLSIAVDEAFSTVPVNLVGTAEGVSWDSIGADYYLLEYSQDDFAHVLVMATPGTAVDTLNLPGGTYQWRVKDADDYSDDWAVGEPITSENDPGTAKVLQSDGDGNYDLFLANPCGVWEAGYFAQHVGSVDDWDGTQEYAAVTGKNKLADFFVGSDDLCILYLTDDANGDALFVDDIYTELPGTLEEQQARIAQISDIRGGAGDDIIDMTSQRFEYIGDGISLHGGDGNDVLWANKGENWLFGDLGDDRLVGASDDDLIVGGAGDDRMHGGGGNDFFTFCENWGKDTVEHLATGSVTLWFVSGDESNWNANTLTYSDGENKVTVLGVTAEQIELKFGNDGSEMFAWLSDLDAFEAYASRKIFEEAATGVAEA